MRSLRKQYDCLVEKCDTTPKWGAKVVYGDTDSVFVLAQGYPAKLAEETGRHVAEIVNMSLPYPMTLKYEKTYLTSVLMAKKRYTGNIYGTG